MGCWPKENVDHFWSNYFRLKVREWLNIFEFNIKRKMFICQCTYWYHFDKWFQFLCMYSVYWKNRSWDVNIYCFWWIKVSLQWFGLEVALFLNFSSCSINYSLHLFSFLITQTKQGVRLDILFNKTEEYMKDTIVI